jgi:ribosomal protein S18 acetylase RimI-like enzyme
MSGRDNWLTLSLKDSSRFGLVVVRGRIDHDIPAPGILHEEIIATGADIAILRVPAGMTAPLHDLMKCGLMPMHADTLVYHERQLSLPVDGPSLPPTLTIEIATTADQDAIAGIARSGFGFYRSHYHANPLLAPALILEGYAEWAIGYISSGANDRETWVVRDQATVVAFATCSLIAQDQIAEVVLNAVDPAHAGRGVYGHLLRHMLRAYQQRGMRVLKISTQVWNYVVQRAWAREGLIITQAYDTYHINALQGQKIKELQ